MNGGEGFCGPTYHAIADEPYLKGMHTFISTCHLLFLHSSYRSFNSSITVDMV